ncbi:hypothetical protein RJ639_029312, partial [Escallonia herrerae]
MEIDSSSVSRYLSPQNRIVQTVVMLDITEDYHYQRLVRLGVPPENVEQLERGLVVFAKDNKVKISDLVSSILPTDEEAEEAALEAEAESKAALDLVGPSLEDQFRESMEAEAESTAALDLVGPSLEDQFRESMSWLQWLMFEGEPISALKQLAKMNDEQRGVCGSVWGNRDIAYRCRTCEHDPTCAICVPCFRDGNHKDHDYSIIYTGGGCCDCGDVTAWKREGFCSKHKGTEQIQSLPEEFAKSVGPVLDSLLLCWKTKLLFVETLSQDSPKRDVSVSKVKKVADELTSAVVEMLLEFCKYSESLLSFVSGRVFMSVGLLDILVRAERFLSEDVVTKLHELLLKLLGEPLFKYEFAKVFLSYYPTVVSEAIKECNDTVFKKYPLVSIFSVQIFTVPTLTPRLVKEINLLALLLECLGDIFMSCAGEDGRLQVSKWGNLYETTYRVVEDIRFVMSHSVVPKFVARDRRDVLRTWMKLLAFLQGMNPQKRETGIHIEEENEYNHLPFVLGRSIANVHSLLVAGAFSVSNTEGRDDEAFFNTFLQDFEYQDSVRRAKVGRLSQESSVSSVTGRSCTLECASRAAESKSEDLPIPASVSWLTSECLRAIENSLGVDNTLGLLLRDSSPKASNAPGNNFFALKRTLSKIRKGRYIFKSYNAPSSICKHTSSSEVCWKQCSSAAHGVDLESGRGIGLDSSSTGFSGTVLEGEYASELEALRVLNLSDWPDITYDVSSQDISVHVPLHRLLSLVLHRVLRRCYGEFASPDIVSATSGNPLSIIYHDFFGHILGGCHPFGFSAFVMEHPLRIRVFCAEVHAGMWRKNGESALISSEFYRSVRWSEQSLELDLFLLQCCAALAPADLYVTRILERFGLSSYLSLNLERSSVGVCQEDVKDNVVECQFGENAPFLDKHSWRVPHFENESVGVDVELLETGLLKGQWLAYLSGYEPVLVQEMLTLIIQIVKERRFCGLTTTECLQRELIYKLSTGDATRSQLVKSLPGDLSKVDRLQEILDMIAVYLNPSGMNQGMYKLRLAYWKELDLYHPRWKPRDLQVAEERYMRFCNVSAWTTQLPQWTKIYDPLKGVAQIATCKVVLQLVRAVLYYAFFTDKLTASRAPDGVLLTALHLLSLALDICHAQKESGDRSCYVGDLIPVLAFAGEEICVGSNRYGDQSLLSLLVSLMRIYKKENPDDFVEAGSFNLSSLIENLLKKFAELDSGCMTKLQQIAPEVVNQILDSIPNSVSDTMGSTSDGDKRKAEARERQAAILEKMRAQQSKFLASINSTAEDGLDGSKVGQDSSSDVEEEICSSDVGHDTEVICSLCHDTTSKNPISFLILLQKSRLLSLVDRGPPSWEQVHQSEKEHVSTSTDTMDVSSEGSTVSRSSETISSYQLMHLIQNAVNEFASDGQPREVNAFLEFIKARFPSVRNVQLPCTSSDTGENTASSHDPLEERMYLLIREGMHQYMPRSDYYAKNEEQIATSGGSPTRSGDCESLLLGKYIAALSKESIDNPSPSENGRSHNDKALSKSVMSLQAYDGVGPSDCDGIYLSSCGHAVHQGCIEQYLSSLKERYIRRIVFEGGHIVDPDQGEFLCPVCRRLANSVLPALPEDLKKVSRLPMPLVASPSDAVGPSMSVDSVDPLHLQEALSLLQTAADVSGRNEILKMFPVQHSGRIGPRLENMFRVLCGMYFPGRNKISGSGRVSHSMIMWDTLKYSLISTEIAARSGRTVLSPNYGVNALYKELKSSSGFILSLLLRIVQSMRTKNSLSVLLRFRGIQLFAESICSGVSSDEFPSRTCRRGGNILCILENAEMEVRYPDIQFWTRASDPVLARDAFSSLMWILFCLPCPFLSCEESFLSLVHMFYAVSITQAIITYCGRNECNSTHLGICDVLITEVSKFMGQCGVAKQYFTSNYMDPSCDIRDVIRGLSFPYLRRCALLWKFVNSSTSSPFSDGVHAFDRSCPADERMEFDSGTMEELVDIEELEKMFKIPSLDVVLNDELLCSLVSKWFRHFTKEFEIRTLPSVLHSTPAVPFKLMLLPRLYQDLLQRYIKQHCPDCGVIQEEPALCLLCGKLCSPNWKTCCRKSGCQTHAMACAAGTGVFLLIRKTTVLLQRSARQAPWPSPYLDAFGEEDIEMYRGKPLYLNEERYAALTHM